MKRISSLLMLLFTATFLVALLHSSVVRARTQNLASPGAIPVQLGTGFYTTVAISTTAAVNTQLTLSIPAPTCSGCYNYVCSFAFNASQNGTSTANTVQVTTSTNFNSFALKYSLGATANAAYDWISPWGAPGGGCTKSQSPTTATTFVSPAALANTAFSFLATYYQAP